MRNFTPGLIMGAALALAACGDDTTGAETSTTDGTTSGGSTSTSTTGSTGSSTTENTTATGFTSGSTGAPTTGGPACGDGSLDDGEACDDGNVEDGDECLSDCTLPTEMAWMKSLDGPAGGNDSFRAVTVDGAGNIYAAGRQFVTDEHFNAWLIRFDSEGNELESMTHNGSASDSDTMSDLAFHSSGDLIVVGSETTMNEALNIAIWRINPADFTDVKWMQSIDGPLSGDDFASAVTTTDTGKIVIGGGVDVMDEGRNFFVARYDETGTEEWQDTYNGSGNNNDGASAVAFDADGNLYVGGSEAVMSQGSDAFLRKYDTNDTEVWTATQGLLAFDQFVNDVVVGQNGNPVVFGGLEDEGVSVDIWVREYDAATGDEVWTNKINGPASSTDSARAAALASDGTLYATGFVSVKDEQANIWTHKYAADGTDLWTVTYNNDQANFGEIGADIVLPADGEIIVVGTEPVTGEGDNAFIAKWTEL